MSFLGRGDLITRLRTGDLVVSPILSTEQIGAASIDLRLGNIMLLVRARAASHVDPSAMAKKPRPGSFDVEVDRRQKHERYEIPFRERLLLHPGTVALVPTLEWLKLPSDLIGSVTARSTWAREGLSIATANLIEPGYEGIATLELANLGQIPIALYPGLRIAQVTFASVIGDTTRPSRGQFNLSFEPSQGQLAKHDSAFLPPTR